MKAVSVAVIHAEHLFTGSTKPKRATLFQVEATPFFWMLTFVALSAAAAISLWEAGMRFLPPSSLGKTGSNGSRKSLKVRDKR